MSDEGRELLKDVLVSILELLQQKVRSGRMTAGDLQSIINVISESGGISATISELADLYHTSEVNVRSVIKRRYIGKPVRRVYYDLMRFSKGVPTSWRVRLYGKGHCGK